SSANLKLSLPLAPEIVNVVLGSAFTPTSDTGWKKLPPSPAPFAPIASSCEAMYFAAISPPRAPVPRPSSRSSERNLMCALSVASLIGEVFCCETTLRVVTSTTLRPAVKRDLADNIKLLILSFDQRHRFRARARVGTKATKHRRSDRLCVGLAHAAQRHARVFRFDHNHDAERVESFKQRVRDIGREPFL